MRRRLGTIAKGTAGLLSGLAVLGALAYGALVLGGYRPVVVYSGSMEPELGVGSVALVKSVPSASVEVGDVITFADPYQPGRLVTHRVVEAVERPEGGIAYRTRGDANAHRDPWTIALPAQAGRTSVDVPYVGYALWYAKTREARMLLIVLVSVLTLSWLLRRIWRPRPAPETSSPAPPSQTATDGTPFWVEALTR